MKLKFITTAGFIVLFVLLSFQPSFQKYDYKSLEMFHKDRSPYPGIVILAVDNKSLQEIGRWPWDRAVEANIINKLNTTGVRAIAVDINFSESQNNFSDGELARAFINSKVPVILPAEPVYTKDSEDPSSFLKPLPVFLSSKVILGNSHVSEGPDGQDSAIPSVLTAGGESYDAFTKVLAKQINAEDTASGIIDFSGPAGTFPTYTVSDFLSGKLGSDIFKDKIVFLGATASDLHDVVQRTPVGIISGVEWHANVLDNLITGSYIKIIPYNYIILVRLFLGLLVLYIALKISNLKSFLTLAGLFIMLMFSSVMLWNMKMAFPSLLTGLFLIVIFVAVSFYKWYLTELEKRKIRQNFKNYFSPQVLEMVLKHPDELKLGGERTDVTVLFSDIRSFTTISESLEPEVLSSMLHEYFTEMTAEILATDGVVDKFIGDAIMAFWGAPIKQDDQADRAVKAAIGMMQRLKKLQDSWKERGLPFVDIGVGINSGSVIVGNMGSKDRFDYTVIGDTVNAASRLESLNKEYHSNIIISEMTRSKLTIAVNTEELGDVLVKGKTEKIKIFKVLI